MAEVETGHLLFGHLLSVITEQCKITMPGNQNKTNPFWSRNYSLLWNATVQNSIYRPSACIKTNVPLSSMRDDLKMKEIHVYCYAFELAVHGQLFGVNPDHLLVLRKCVQWIGKYFSDTVDDQCIKWMRQEFCQIVQMIQQKNGLADLQCRFQGAQTLRNWRQLIYMNLKFDSRGAQGFGLKFESSHLKYLTRLLHNQNYKQQTMLLNVCKMRRTLKNASFGRCGMISGTKHIKYGSQIHINSQLFTNREKQS